MRPALTNALTNAIREALNYSTTNLEPEPVINYVARLNGVDQYWQLSDGGINTLSGDVLEIDFIGGALNGNASRIIGAESFAYSCDTGTDASSIRLTRMTGKLDDIEIDNLVTPIPSSGNHTLSLNTLSDGSLRVLGGLLAGDRLIDTALSNFRVIRNGTVINEIPLTNKAQDATQLPTVGNVSATMIGYTPDVWEVVQPFTPLSLFINGEDGIWLDPSDLSTLYQDSAMTIPVTSDGDPIGGIRDKSGNNNHATQSNDSARPIYKTDGTLHWIEFNGSSYLVMNQFITGNNDRSFIVGYQSDKPSGESFLFDACDRVGSGAGEGWGLSSEVESFFVRVNGFASFSPPQVLNSVNVIAVEFGLSIGGSVNNTGVRLNGEQVLLSNGSGTTVETRVAGSSFLGSSSASTSNLDGRIFSVISTTSLLSAPTKLDVESYVAKKAGVAL